MTDYESLVNALRKHRGWAPNETLDAAADAIEVLMRDFRDYISSQVKRDRGVYACCYCKNRESKYYPGCEHEECDGVSGWEYGEPKEETE